MKRFAVVDRAGAGWGRYHTRAEADARAANLNLITGESFDVCEVVP